MNNHSFLPRNLKTLAALSLLFPASVSPVMAQQDAAAAVSPAAADPIPIDELREQLIASVRADILAKRDKPENSTAVAQLAQAIESLVSDTVQGDSYTEMLELQRQQGYGRRAGGWQAAVQAHGSEKSMKLGQQYGQRMQRDAVEKAAKRSAEAEALGLKVAQRIFAAKTGAELDPLLEEITPYLQQGNPMPIGIKPETSMKMQRLLQFITAWQSHLAAREAGNLQEALQTLRGIRSDQGNTVPWVPRSELAKQIEAAKRLSGLPSPEEVMKLVKRISDQALAADKGDAIDPLLIELRNVQSSLQAEDRGAHAQEVQQLISFLENWQKALILRATGDATGFKDALRQVEGYGARGLDIPRSKILERLYDMESTKVVKTEGATAGAPVKIESPDAALDRLKGLEDLGEPNLQALSSAVELLPGTSSERQSWSQIVQQLQAIARQYGELKSGLATRVNLGMNLGGTGNPKVLDLQRQLSLASLHRLLGEEAGMPPEASENSVTYLRRLLTTAREHKDWRLVQRIIETAQSTNVQDPLLKSTDTTALTSLISAMTQEKAGQFAFAASSYLAALKTGSEWLPVEEIGNRLRAIEKEHPADYTQGVEWARTPPVPNYPPGYYPPGYRPPTSYPQFQRSTGEQPVIIPEKKVQTPSAKPAEK